MRHGEGPQLHPALVPCSQAVRAANNRSIGVASLPCCPHGVMSWLRALLACACSSPACSTERP